MLEFSELKRHLSINPHHAGTASMTLLPYPIVKILLPYDGSASARNALELAANLCIADKEAVQGLTLLQVIGGSYLARHIQNVDLRVTRMDKNKDWQRIRKHYIEGEVLPLLEEGKKILQSLGVQAPIEDRIVEGKVSEEIIRLSQKEAFSTIIMGRRGLSPLQAMLLGSVTRSVLSLAQEVTVYVAAQEATPRTGCPISPMLLPLDGSESSLAAVRQAAALAQAFRPMRASLTLFHVVDIALMGMKIHEGDNALVEEGEKILTVARGILQEAGLGGCWEEKLVSGQPAQAIVQHAEEGGYPLILMGSRGLSGLAKLLIGSVTSNVVHTVSRAAVAVVYS
jgi:nucleotide-binding universal stress UspA family protein